MTTNGRWQTTVVLGLAVVTAWAGRTRADFVFGTPVNLGPSVNSSDSEYDPYISADGLELYFQSYRAGGYGAADIYVATRATTQDAWGPAANLGPKINTAAGESGPCVTPDGLTLYFNSGRDGGAGNSDLYVATRASRSEPWGEPVNLGPVVNSPFNDINPTLSSDGLTLLFADSENDGATAPGAGPRPGGRGNTDIWMTQRPSLSEPWGPPINLTAVNSGAVDGAPELSADGLMLFFNSTRPGGFGQWVIWVRMRNTTQDPWGPPVNLGAPVNTGAWEGNASLSADGRTLYFASSRPGTQGFTDLYQASITPVADFNGDGKVDGEEARIMLASWGTDEPLCDIGPTPFGDGIVDMKDMAVLTQCASATTVDPTLIACWTFDEAEGLVACDCAGMCDGTLMGGALCQPGAGMVGGAVLLDGVDDYVTAGFPYTAMTGPMSVIVWVKGGKPGQTILSQKEGFNWLAVDAATGTLTSNLRSQGRLSKELPSPTVVTDGCWHRIVLTWDGVNRSLYVDGQLAATDTQTGVKRTYKDLHIGAAGDLAAGAFWSGLIDDVRIYDRVVKP